MFNNKDALHRCLTIFFSVSFALSCSVLETLFLHIIFGCFLGSAALVLLRSLLVFWEKRASSKVLRTSQQFSLFVCFRGGKLERLMLVDPIVGLFWCTWGQQFHNTVVFKLMDFFHDFKVVFEWCLLKKAQNGGENSKKKIFLIFWNFFWDNLKHLWKGGKLGKVFELALIYIFWFLLDIIVVLTGHIDINSWLKIFNLDVDFLSSFNLTSFFSFGNEVYMSKSLFLLDNKHFFLFFKYRSCLLDVLNFSFFNMTEVIK